MRLVFAGTPTVALASLDSLADEHDIVAVITREDAPTGRKRILTPSPVNARAVELGLPVIATNRLDASVTEKIAVLEPDLGVIVAYGGLVREPLLSTPRLGWINLHFSLLPRWRGAAPVQWSIRAGDPLVGATVFQLVAELDAGPIFGSFSRPVGTAETSGELLESLAGSGAELVRGIVNAMAVGNITAKEQVGEVTLAPKIALENARIDFAEPAVVLSRMIRSVTPEPGAFTTVNGQRLKVLAARPAPEMGALPSAALASVEGRIFAGTSTHPVELLTVQPAGKKPMAAADWWRGLAQTEGLVAE
jgi:methionyl-tRNA formyltransferase